MKPDSASGHSNARRQFLLAAAIVAATLLVYIPAMSGGLFWDDRMLVADNPLIKAPDGLRRFWLTTEAPEYLPVTFTMHWVEWRLLGAGPAGHHVVNILLHACGAVLLWRVLRRLRVPGAWLAGVLFAVHPVAAASVAWISERKNTLSMVFYLLSLLACLIYDERDKRRWYALALALFLLALLAKTSIVMLPPVLLLCAWWRRGTISRKDIVRSVPFFALALALGLVTVWFQWHNVPHGDTARPWSAVSRAPAAGWIVWFYLFKLVVPAGLCAVYPRWHIDGASVLAYLPLVFLLAGLAGLWARRASPSAVSSGPNGWGRAPLFALAYFILMLLPVLGFVDMTFMGFSLVADHLQYAAMIGVLAFAAGILAQLAAAPGRKGHAGVLAAAGCVAVLAALTWHRAALYGDEERLWRDNVAKNPSAWLAWNNLGRTQIDAGHDAEAVRCLDEAIKLRPDYALAFYNRGTVLYRMNRFVEALRDYDAAIAFRPGYGLAYYNRGNIQFNAGRLDLALGDYDQAIKFMPEYARAWNNRGTVFRRLGRSDEALRDYDRSLALDPKNVRTWCNRALLYCDRKEYAKALADIRMFEKLGGHPDPDFVKGLTEAAAHEK